MKTFGRTGSTFVTVVVAAIVLAIISTTGAVAGSLITSKRIKNNTIKSIDVRNGTLQGVDVKDGNLTGADLANGSVTGADLAGGPSGAVITPLASGRTVRGTIGGRANNLAAGEEAAANASLPVPAPVALDDTHVAVNGEDEPVGACPGTATNPSAAPGFVCIYPWSTANAEASPSGHVWGSDGAANERYGFQLSFRALAAGDATYFANWAYTAP